ncbi:hypothetical protein GCM10009720_04970 [Yaniella flava]|uniref:Signal peptidase I n=1 Tax=Yaniella flava TaxID=287930 RepID=A0ABP5FK12_9MICC
MRSRLGDILLSVLAVAGAICLILVVVGLTMNVSIMMFRTGSMDPTIPAGSIALVREIPAAEMSEGDIVTVDRGDDLLPVTHRVTEITDLDPQSDAVTFVMRGDANNVDDPEPYTAQTVRRVFFSIPGVAPVIQWFQNPLVLGGLTLAASALVVWAFWPRKDEETSAPKRGVHSAQALVLPLALVVAAPLLTSPEESDVSGEYLRMRSFGDVERMTNLAPGDSATWAVDIWADTPEPDVIDLHLSATGQLAEQPDALTTVVTLCSPHPTATGDCAEDAQRWEINTPQLADSNVAQPIGTMSTEEPRRVLITATLSDSPGASIQETTAKFRVTAAGSGEELSMTPDNSESSPTTDDADTGLASTGFTGALWSIAIAVVLIIAGLAITTARGHSLRRKSGRGPS